MNELERQKAVAREMKRAGRETTGYVRPCDDAHCNVCRKAKGEKAPWNR